MRHHFRHAIGEHQQRHDPELTGLLRVGAAIVHQDDAGWQPVEWCEPIKAGVGYEEQPQSRGMAREVRLDHARVANERFGRGNRRVEIGSGAADTDLMAASRIRCASRRRIPHLAGEVE
jgi:hypothetical protein